MGDKPDKVVEEFLARLKQDYTLHKVILFGSRAKGDFLESSDYDLLIISPNFEGIAFVKRMSLVYEYWTSEKPLEALCYTPAEFEKKRRQIGIVSQALREGIEIPAA